MKADYGDAGSVRLDVVQFNAAGNPIAIFDLKTGGCDANSRANSANPSASSGGPSADHDDTTVTNKEFADLGKQLLPDLPGFRVQKHMVVKYPLGDVVRGLHFERSSDKRFFYVWVFMLPLFVPTKYLNFTFGERLLRPGPGDRWNADAPNLIAALGLR